MALLSWFRKSILIKLSFIVLLTSTLTLGAVGLWEYQATREAMQRELITRAGMLAERLALGLVKIVWDYDTDLAESIILSEMQEKSVVGILVWEKGEPKALYGGWRTAAGTIVMADSPLSEDRFVENTRVILRKGAPIGAVRVFMTDRYLKRSLDAAMESIFIRVILLDAVLVLLLIVLMCKFFINPLSNLKNGMLTMPKGPRDQQVKVVSPDEIGQITAAFNKMAREIRMREAALQESEGKYRDMFESSVEGIFQTTRDGRIIRVNLSLARILGYDRPEELMHSISDVATQLYVDSYQRADLLRHLDQHDTIEGFECRLYKKDGSIIWTAFNTRVVRSKHGDIAYLEGFLTDITERKRSEEALRESEAQHRVIIQTAMDGFFMADLHGRLIEVNETFSSMTGYSKQELLRMCIAEIEAIHTQEQIKARIKTSTEGKALRFESRHRRKDGTLFDVEVSLQYQARGQGRVLAFLRDITERKVAEKALRRHHDHLEELVAERTAQLAEAKALAEAANAAKSEFLARMSHEIRTPLNVVTGLTNIVLKSELSDEQRDRLNKVRIAGSNLLKVINEILDFSKVEAGRLELAPAPFDLDVLLVQSLGMFSKRTAGKDLELIVDVSPQVPRQLNGDAGRLAQVLTNIVDNALKFTETGEVLVKVEKGKKRDPAAKRTGGPAGPAVLQFSVSDTGSGIPPTVLPALFEPFTQADSTLTRRHEGTGLGLAICRRLVELMGGTIASQSTPGKGSCFTFTVMMAVQDKQNPPLLLPSDLMGTKVLVVEDRSSARRVLGQLLTAFGFAVSTVANGEKALETFQRTATKAPYRLLLVNWKMPGMDGIETARHIRRLVPEIQDDQAVDTATQPIKQPPPIIILVTAHGQELARPGIDTAVVDTWLAKPVHPARLFDTILALFGRSAVALPSCTRKPAARPIRNLAGRRVLVVEDSELNRDVAVELLKDTGLTVEIAENGKVAVDKVTRSEKGYFDAVLMDIQMPVMDGYAATRRIREWENEPQPQISNLKPKVTAVPIIALTAHALIGEKEKCLAAGMDDYIAKPIDEAQLQRLLGEWVRDPQPDPPAHPEVPVLLDVDEALKRLGGKRWIYVRVLEQFISDCGHFTETMGRSLANRDFKGAARLAHKMKGAAGQTGAKALYKMALELERTVATQPSDIAIGSLAEFGKHIEQTVATINEFLVSQGKQTDLVPQPLGQPEKLPPPALLESIRQHASRGRFSQIERTIDDLESEDRAYTIFCEGIRKRIRKYDEAAIAAYINRWT